MFLEEPIYHQAALVSVSVAVAISCLVFFSHLAYAYHTDVPNGIWLLLSQLRRFFFPLSSPSSSVCRHLPQVRECSAPPRQPPLYVCRIVLLVPVYALTSYLGLTYATPPPSSGRLLAPILAQPYQGTGGLPLRFPAAQSGSELQDDASLEAAFVPLVAHADPPPSRRLSAVSNPSPPLLSWSSGSLAVATPRRESRQRPYSFPSLGEAASAAAGLAEADAGQAAAEGLGERLGIDFEGVEEGTGGLLGFSLHAVRDVYEVYVLYSFIALVISVLGGEESAVEQLHLKGSLQHPWPFNLVLPPLDCNRKLLRRIKLGAAQFVFVKPVATVAMYALVLFYLAVRQRLRAFRLLPKFLCIKAVVFFCFWQALVLRWLVALLLSDFESGPNKKLTFLQGLAANAKAAAVALRVSDWMLCIEMFPFAIAEACAFSVRDLRAVAASSPSFNSRMSSLSCHAATSSPGSAFFSPSPSRSHGRPASPGSPGRGEATDALEEPRQAKGETRFSLWEKLRGGARDGSTGAFSEEDDSERQLLCTEPSGHEGAQRGRPRVEEEKGGAGEFGFSGSEECGGERACFLATPELPDGDASDSLLHSTSPKKLEKPLRQFVKGVRDLLVADDVLCDATDALFGRNRCRREYLLEERKREREGCDEAEGEEDEMRTRETRDARV
ncbi:ACR261Cp, related [Neospora caninum Liverpool]|uniref:ACR261Cp, related n=1 Tax=Neospora caninum (strain Liverpool) TaxID=572307 RepID=F0VIT8_NEOCL|nr:ACR261Cp, related [Neospora caninum Liverpool]CBZ53649.1 ACR261Cp, related [Neospora caninum Liverpool]|eukprot:XP_003883681.1 ACR261Cp, related [Neospora caninum Liverpool]